MNFGGKSSGIDRDVGAGQVPRTARLRPGSRPRFSAARFCRPPTGLLPSGISSSPFCSRMLEAARPDGDRGIAGRTSVPPCNTRHAAFPAQCGGKSSQETVYYTYSFQYGKARVLGSSVATSHRLPPNLALGLTHSKPSPSAQQRHAGPTPAPAGTTSRPLWQTTRRSPAARPGEPHSPMARGAC